MLKFLLPEFMHIFNNKFFYWLRLKNRAETVTQNFRVLTTEEQIALKAILSVEFQDHLELKNQVSGLALRSIDETLFELAPLINPHEFCRKQKTFPIPVESTYKDRDNAIVYVDLFVNENNKLMELEIWKPDGKPVQTYFAHATLFIKAEIK